MSVFLQATLEVKSAGLAEFCRIMETAKAIVEGRGWKLVGAYIQRTGRLNTVIDLWELEDMNHFETALQAMAADSRYPEFKRVLDEVVISETLVFADKAPYAH